MLRKNAAGVATSQGDRISHYLQSLSSDLRKKYTTPTSDMKSSPCSSSSFKDEEERKHYSFYMGCSKPFSLALYFNDTELFSSLCSMKDNNKLLYHLWYHDPFEEDILKHEKSTFAIIAQRFNCFSTPLLKLAKKEKYHFLESLLNANLHLLALNVQNQVKYENDPYSKQPILWGGGTILHVLCTKIDDSPHWLNIVEILLSEKSVNINILDAEKCTPMMRLYGLGTGCEPEYHLSIENSEKIVYLTKIFLQREEIRATINQKDYYDKNLLDVLRELIYKHPEILNEFSRLDEFDFFSTDDLYFFKWILRDNEIGFLQVIVNHPSFVRELKRHPENNFLDFCETSESALIIIMKQAAAGIGVRPTKSAPAQYALNLALAYAVLKEKLGKGIVKDIIHDVMRGMCETNTGMDSAGYVEAHSGENDSLLKMIKNADEMTLENLLLEDSEEDQYKLISKIISQKTLNLAPHNFLNKEPLLKNTLLNFFREKNLKFRQNKALRDLFVQESTNNFQRLDTINTLSIRNSLEFSLSTVVWSKERHKKRRRLSL